MANRFNVQLTVVHLINSNFQPSIEAGKTLCVNADGSTLTIEPDGSERPGGTKAGDPNWDSPYTRGTVCGDLLVYQSATNNDPGVPVAYKMVIPS